MPTIKDESYTEFLHKGTITLIDKDSFQRMLDNVEHKHKEQARALFILLFWTGRRPCEILDLTPDLIIKENRKLKVMFPTSKHGVYTTLHFPLKNPHFKEVWAYASKAGFAGFKMFWAFRGKKGGGIYKKTVQWLTPKGERRAKEYIVISRRLRYWIKKWSGITPYWFRHNRFSTMATQGADDREIMHAKGGRSQASVQPYLHLSSKRANRMSKYYV